MRVSAHPMSHIVFHIAGGERIECESNGEVLMYRKQVCSQVGAPAARHILSAFYNLLSPAWLDLFCKTMQTQRPALSFDDLNETKPCCLGSLGSLDGLYDLAEFLPFYVHDLMSVL